MSKRNNPPSSGAHLALRGAALFLLVSALAAPLWANGQQETNYKQATGTQTFTGSIDLTDQKAGTYNVIIKTTDAAGNVSFTGPFNIVNDPDSALPIVTVASPEPKQRISANVNIVGAATATEGVGRVEVRIDAGTWKSASGKAFWSYSLDLAGLVDGSHQIDVRGFDVHGLEGHTASVPIITDQFKPVLTVLSPVSGERISGDLDIQGTLADGNALASMAWSVDGAKTWKPLELAGDPASTNRTWTAHLGSRAFADGPVVLWFKGTDRQGSESRAAHLLFADNTPPLIEVLSPADTGLHGVVRFAGKVTKKLGISSLSAQFGKGDPVPIAVVAGNPFWSVDLDLSAEPGNEVVVNFEAIDTAGNKGSLQVRRKIDREAGLPRLDLQPALNKTTVSGALKVTGLLLAPEGAGAVAWSLNGSPEKVETVGPSFSFPANGLQSGPNTLTLVPIDALKVRGHPVTLSFTGMLDKGSIAFTSLFSGEQVMPFTPGVSVAPDRKNKVRVVLLPANPLKDVTWSLGGGTPVKVTPVTDKTGTYVDLALPADPPFGVVPLKVEATDAFGQTSTATSFLNILNFSQPQGTDGLALVDGRVGSNPLVLTPETPLLGYFSAGVIRSVELQSTSHTGAAVAATVSFAGPVVTIRSERDGRLEGVRVHIITDKGRVYDTELGTLLSDVAPPVVALSSPLSGTWAGSTLKVEGKVSDSGGLARFEWSVDNGKTWAPLDLPPGTSRDFTRNITLPGPDNAVNLLLRATDNAGRIGTVLAVVRRDTTAPEIDLAVPQVETGQKGIVYLTGRFTDEGALAKAEVVLARKTVALPVDRAFSVSLDLETYLTSPVKIRVTDFAGNQAEKVVQLVAVPAPEATQTPAPAMQILFPTADRKGLNGVLPVTGRVMAFDPLPQLTVKGEGLAATIVELSPEGYFNFDVDASTWKDRTLSFSATNDAKQTATLNFRLPYDDAADLPQARTLPAPDKLLLTGNVTVSGWIGDNRGQVGWISQIDNGIKTTSAPDVTKPPLGTFLIDLGVPALGNHRLTVTPLDASGKEGKAVTVDFTQAVAPGPVSFTSLEFGAALAVAKDSRLQGQVPSTSGWKKLEVRFADVEAGDIPAGPFTALAPVKSKDSEGVWTFDTPIPTDLPYSRIAVIVRGEDNLGQKVEGRTLLHRIWPKDPSQVNDNEGVVFTDTRLDESGRLALAPEQSFAGVFRGRAIKSVAVVPPTAGVEAAFVGNQVTLTPHIEGLFGPLSLTVTTVDGEIFSSKPMSVFSDLGGPVVQWTSPATGDWILDSVTAQGALSDPSGVATSELSVDSGATWQNLVLTKGQFSVKLPVTSADGLVGVLIRSTDKGGHTSLSERWVTKDTLGPQLAIVTPEEGHQINGLTTIVGSATDAGDLTLVEYSDNGKTYLPANGLAVFRFNLDFASYTKLPEQWFIRATDKAGNQSVLPVTFLVDQEADKPVIQIQTPADREVVRSDFKISGMVFDDDGVKALSWRIDGGAWNKVENSTSFTFPETLSSFTDNEHRVEMKAEDIYGTVSNVYSSSFRVSLAQPRALLLAPDIQKTVSGVVSLIGASLDRNGIKEVSLSLDNGLSWNRADFRKKEELLLAPATDALVKDFLPTERQEWEWRFDTKTLKDGTYSVLVRSTDSYGTEALYTSLFNLDNTPPQVTLNSPTDGQPLLDSLKLEGRSSDNVTLQSLKALLRLIDTAEPVAGTKAPAPVSSSVLVYDLPVTPTFTQTFALENLPAGWYNLRIEARDAAGNTTYLARNVQISASATFDKVEILYPLAGETRHGMFVVAGKVTSRSKVDKATVLIDGKTKVAVTVDDKGYFQTEVFGDLVDQGEHTLRATVQLSPTVTVASETRKVLFENEGPYVQVSNLQNGSYVTNRPIIEGVAGWMAIQDVGSTTKIAPEHEVTVVEVSLDNGKTFSQAKGAEAWAFRLESLDIPDGQLPLVFRARFADGSSALQRMMVTVSQTPPAVSLTKNIENSRVYGKVDLAGYTNDTTGKSKVEIAVREGDKSNYGAPTFIQGLYTDSHVLGATWWEQAVGFSFSNDAVKVQGQVGMAPSDSRFSGTIAGVKLIANIAQIPFSFFLGPDWDWYSMSVSVGANFSLFSMSDKFLDFSGQGVFLGSLLAQWEWAKVTLKNQMFFRTYSWYGELTSWFISSEVQATVVPTFSTGIRIGIW